MKKSVQSLEFRVRRKITRCLYFILFLTMNYELSTINCLYCKTPNPSSIIDIPTAEVVEYSDYDLSFRLHGAGGVLSKMTFGVFKPINIGISWDVDKLIGAGSEKIDTRPPAILFKARVFAGGLKLPAISLGYDGQGYGIYNSDTDKYQYREKGVYLVLTREYLLPGLEMSGGGNIFDFDKDGVYGFVGASFGIENKVLLLGEYDNIKKMPQNRANLGMKLFVTSNVDVSVAGRNLFKGTRSERIAIVNYRGKF
ncbi:MAG: hypothetical protein HY919_07800 [Elusimicrobia bacterium]|nr:hypothetical protein [Elusimicrobiota bacterium]